MRIYVGHSVNFDFQKELYDPIRQSHLNNQHVFVLPHENSDKAFNSKDFLKNEADMFIAEVSFPSTGLGIELGWADTYGVPIIFIYRRGSKIPGSLKAVSNSFVEYSDGEDLVSGIEQILSKM